MIRRTIASGVAPAPLPSGRQSVVRVPPDSGRRVGRAVPRGSVPPAPDTPGRVVNVPRYYWYSPYAFGFAGYAWDPYWWGYDRYSRYGYGGYYGSRYGNYYGSYGTPWGYYGAPSYGSTYYQDYPSGSIRLKVKPERAEVFVDGYYVGVVDEFDGFFQKLRLEPGVHRIEMRADGYEPLSLETRILPDRKVTFEGELLELP